MRSCGCTPWVFAHRFGGFVFASRPARRFWPLLRE
jgi:hypothetical protein